MSAMNYNDPPVERMSVFAYEGHKQSTVIPHLSPINSKVA